MFHSHSVNLLLTCSFDKAIILPLTHHLPLLQNQFNNWCHERLEAIWNVDNASPTDPTTSHRKKSHGNIWLFTLFSCFSEAKQNKCSLKNRWTNSDKYKWMYKLTSSLLKSILSIFCFSNTCITYIFILLHEIFGTRPKALTSKSKVPH